MADKTTHYELVKPLASEFYDVEVQNGNMDKIDIALYNLKGLYEQAMLVADWNSITKSGFYYDSGAASNRPSFLTGPLVGWVITCGMPSEHTTKQIVYEYMSGQGACRMDSAPGWYPWTHLPTYVHAGQKSGSSIGTYATAEGSSNIASGRCSHAGGSYTQAGDYQYAIGLYNKASSGVASAGSTAGSFFVIGNGTSDTARSNAFRVSATGAAYGALAYNTGGADYAEYFEWADGNPNDEDRRGRCVTLSGDKIVLADADSQYILGIVSANPSVVGNAYDDQWQGMYAADVFGGLIHERKIIPAYTDENGIEHPETATMVAVLNPDYDPSRPYIPRSERPEWAIVGMLGKMIATDDGTCEENGYCRPTDGGIVTASAAGYRVLKRIDDTHVQIIFR